MERNRPSTLGAPFQECPILCITKSIVFMFVAVFVLYLPLGDPHVHCSHTSLRGDNDVVCCLCDFHNFLLKAGQRTIDVVELLVCITLDALYEAKLKFYSVLEKLDRDDLCRSVCCPVESEDDLIENKDKRVRPCRCNKKNCRRNVNKL